MRRVGVVIAAGAVLLAGCGSSAGERTALRSEGGDTPVGFLSAADEPTTTVDPVTTTSVVESGGTTSIVTSPPTTAAPVTSTTVAGSPTTTLTTVANSQQTTTTTPGGGGATPTTAPERQEVPALTVGIPWQPMQGGPSNPNQCGEYMEEAVAVALDASVADTELAGRGYKFGLVRFRGATGRALDNPPAQNLERAQQLITQCAASNGGQADGIVLTTTPDNPGSRAFAEVVKRQLDGYGFKNMKNQVTIR